jgi:hypothetical protein
MKARSKQGVTLRAQGLAHTPRKPQASDALLVRSELVGDRTRKVRVVDLATLIGIKAATGRRRDRLVLPILPELLRRRK